MKKRLLAVALAAAMALSARLSGMAEGHSGKLAVVGKWHAPNRLEANQREVVPF